MATEETTEAVDEQPRTVENQTRRDLKKLAKNLERARSKEADAWDELRAAMKEAHEKEGWTFSEIGEIVGVTKARVYQIVTGNRGGKKKADTVLGSDQEEREAEGDLVAV